MGVWLLYVQADQRTYLHSEGHTLEVMSFGADMVVGD